MRWCDMTCESAGLPGEGALDGSGSCRTFQAIYCGKLERHVHKNMPCEAERADAAEKRRGDR
ncbi:MAG: hypothetical protein ACNS63_00325 [Candidatus Nitrospinota bacterium M3_3B_026]